MPCSVPSDDESKLVLTVMSFPRVNEGKPAENVDHDEGRHCPEESEVR